MIAVPPRADNGGDQWAQAHRSLGPGFTMTDIDGAFGLMAFGQNTQDTLFAEIKPDGWENRQEIIRSFQLVALFDRKRTAEAARHAMSSMTLAWYLHLCRIISMHQTKPSRFFFVIGGQLPPWRMVEIDIHSGELEGDDVTINTTGSREWLAIWRALGLTALREQVDSISQPARARVMDL